MEERWKTFTEERWKTMQRYTGEDSHVTMEGAIEVIHLQAKIARIARKHEKLEEVR